MIFPVQFGINLAQVNFTETENKLDEPTERVQFGV